MPHDVDLTLLRSFAAAARAGSLNRAAGALGLSQPAVSQHLRRLEAATGRVLLERTTRGVALTAAGRDVLRYTERILALTDELARGSEAGLSGALRIGLLEDVVAGGLTDVLADFAAVHPAATLDVVVAGGAALGRGLAEGTLDLVVGDPHSVGSAAGPPRRRAPFRLAWAAHRRLDLRADPIPVVLFRAPCSWRDGVVDALGAGGRRWRAVVQASSLAAVQAAVAAGLGVSALLPGTVPSGTRVHTPDPGGAAVLPPPPHVELALYRGRTVEHAVALAALEARLWRTLGEHG